MSGNERAEAFVLSRLPATYGSMVHAAMQNCPPALLGKTVDREIDKALQRLRRRGEISFVRDGRLTIWSKATHPLTQIEEKEAGR